MPRSLHGIAKMNHLVMTYLDLRPEARRVAMERWASDISVHASVYEMAVLAISAFWPTHSRHFVCAHAILQCMHGGTAILHQQFSLVGIHGLISLSAGPVWSFSSCVISTAQLVSCPALPWSAALPCPALPCPGELPLDFLRGDLGSGGEVGRQCRHVIAI